MKEVVNQLRFRNIGGLIIIDLIDMESQENREKVYRALQEALRSDKAKTNILKISELGLVEMTRKRTRENLVQTLCEPCAYCEGRGYVLSRESVAFKVLREIKKDLPRFCGRQIAVTVSTHVAEQLLTTEKESVTALGEELGREIEIRARPGLHQEQFEVLALDSGPAVEIPLRWLDEPTPPAEKKGRSKRRGNGAATPDADAAQAAEAPEADAAKAAEASETDGAQAADASDAGTPEAEKTVEAESAVESTTDGAAEPEPAKPSFEPLPLAAPVADTAPEATDRGDAPEGGASDAAPDVAASPIEGAAQLDDAAQSRILPGSEKSEES